MLDENGVFLENAEAVQAGQRSCEGYWRTGQGSMCVENTFEKGAVGWPHHHPPRITYVVSGEFEFDIEGAEKD